MASIFTPLGQTEDQGAKLGVFCTGPAIPQTGANLLSEMMGTMILIFGLLMIGANDFVDGLNPLAVGGLGAVIGIARGGTTGYAINPARDFGPRAVSYYLSRVKVLIGVTAGYQLGQSLVVVQVLFLL